MAGNELVLSLNVSKKQVQCVGPAYMNLKSGAANTGVMLSNAAANSLPGEQFAVDLDYLKSLDPKDWKDQDHYAVLGLKALRFNATNDDIRRSYRHMLMQHHPDKRKANGIEVNKEQDYFTCITRAYEILGSIKTRRAYDSVDPLFDNSLPMRSEIELDFYNTFNEYFQRNARWSERPNVPAFGYDDATREAVDEFYHFWYDFKSWREYSYMDEEEREKADDRDERRWMDKENKSMRLKRKKEEMSRIRALVNLAYNNDKRIQRFKQQDKERKLAAKRAKLNAAMAQKAEEERIKREAQLAKEQAEKAEQQRIKQICNERQQQKKLLKKERKMLRDKLKANKYYAKNDKETLKNMEGLERICEAFNLSELQELNKNMMENSQIAFFTALKQADDKIKAQMDAAAPVAAISLAAAAVVKDNVPQKKKDIWCNENVQLLIKAVNLFPGGTTHRWSVIARYINQHSSNNPNVNVRHVINKVKEMQNTDFKSPLQTQTNDDDDAAYESFENVKKDSKHGFDITINNATPGGDAPAPTAAEAAPAPTAAAPAPTVKKRSKNKKKQPAATAEPPTGAVSTARPLIAWPSTAALPTDWPPTAWSETAGPSSAAMPNAEPPTARPSNAAPPSAALPTTRPSTAAPSTAAMSTARPLIAWPSTAALPTVWPPTAGPPSAAIPNAGPPTAEPAIAGLPTAALSTAKQPAAEKVWSAEDQALLEEAIRTYPVTTPDRWQRIAECVPSKTKKDCIRRVKQLVELVNTKK